MSWFPSNIFLAFQGTGTSPTGEDEEKRLEVYAYLLILYVLRARKGGRQGLASGREGRGFASAEDTRANAHTHIHPTYVHTYVHPNSQPTPRA